jgi:hypothetical protein
MTVRGERTRSLDSQGGWRGVALGTVTAARRAVRFCEREEIDRFKLGGRGVTCGVVSGWTMGRGCVRAPCTEQRKGCGFRRVRGDSARRTGRLAAERAEARWGIGVCMGAVGCTDAMRAQWSAQSPSGRWLRPGSRCRIAHLLLRMRRTHARPIEADALLAPTGSISLSGSAGACALAEAHMPV